MKPDAALFAAGAPIGLLKGFSPLPHMLEVDVVVPHHEKGLPGFGEFLLVELNDSEALVGRVSRYQAAGQLATERGDAYLVDLARTEEKVPQAIVRQMLRYTLKIQLLGHLASPGAGDGMTFSVGQRTFATMGSSVRMPSDAALRFLCNVGLMGDPTAVPLGHLVYGQEEFTHVPVHFSVARLKGKRTFVFARAGYGKSNLLKYVLSQLYASPPDVGLLLFDPEGEYALPDAHGRPGLVNVPALSHRISLYTNRQVEPEYAEVRKGVAAVDFGDFPPQDIVTAFVPVDKQDAVFANLLRSMDWGNWKKLVALLNEKAFAADDRRIGQLLGYHPKTGDVSMAAVRNNLVPAIRRLHKPGANLAKDFLEELRQARMVIVDTSLLGGEDAFAITSLLMNRVFQHNVRHLTDVSGPTVRCLAVLEEAQTFLGQRSLDERQVFVRWVKEGRKYGLGCILVTQQPGAISEQIISQADNFFVLHLLNETDLRTLQRHNAYYTDEILGFIRNEPIPGNCYFWSAPNQPFVLPVRVQNFELLCQQKKPQPARPEVMADRKMDIRVGKLVQEALAVNPRLFVYKVATFSGKKEQGWLAFSRDYLHNTVAQALGEDPEFKGLKYAPDWLQQQLQGAIETVLKRHKVRSGYAVLEGVTRTIWSIPAADVTFKNGKACRPAPVDIRQTLEV